MKVLKIVIEAILMFCFFGICYIGSLLVLAKEAEAKDLGVHGHVFEIKEQDFLEVINAKLKAVNWDKFNQKILNKTKDSIENPTEVTGIKRAKEAKEYFYDPTYVLDQNIYDNTGKFIHAKGTKVNPLEFTSLREALLFIDGDDESQIEFALKQYKQTQEKLKIILVKGSPLKLQRQEKIWIYFDQGGILTNKLGIAQVPALVTQEDLRLKVKIFGENL